ncbi:hypothetical protein CRYUN_Cryun17cG0002100 [Craigia yunnanensis]
MTRIHNLVPKKEHYASMVDMLCRSGRIHKNQELVRKAAAQLFRMELLRDAATYVSMSNIYAAAGQWDNVGKGKKAMRERGIRKVPAYSWVEIRHKVHVFSANDVTSSNGGNPKKDCYVVKTDGKGRLQA